MKFEILGKNGFEPNGRIKAYAEKRLNKVVSFFEDGVVKEVRVVCKQYKDHMKVEVTIPFRNNILRAEVSDPDIYAAIDLVNDKLVSQIRRYKDKLTNHLEKDGFKDTYTNDLDIESLEKEVLATQLVKNKKVELVPMTVEEAIEAMELSSHDFYIFLDKATKQTNVVYRRSDGDYAVIETKPIS